MSAGRLAVSTALVLLAWAGVTGASLPTVRHEGRPYVELTRVAASLRSSTLEASGASPRARLRTPRHVVTFTRNWSQILVDDRPVVLDAPVRVRRGVWLVPESFVGRVLPALAAGAPAVAAQAGPRAQAPLPEVALDDLRFRSYPSFTRVVLETSAPASHTIEPGGPREARIRLHGLAGPAQTEEVRDGFVEEIRLERAGADAVLRVVFAGAAGTVRASALADPPRLVLDFARPADAAAPRESRVEATPLRTIVLDAGHGGHDSGAVGPTGLMEKDLVLDVTRRAARLLEERLGLRALLTRDADVFIPLRDRTSLANRQRADLFVSIHANAHRQSGTDGVETYFLSSEATDSAARQVAALENGVVQLEKPAARSTGSSKVDIVKTILWDLAQSEFQIESERLAAIVHDSMTQSLRIGNRGVKQAGFYVLGGAAMPAILLEIGFVTNPREERKLKEPRYRDEIARAVVAGLAEYKRHWDQRTRAAGDGPALTRAR
jgi:N-acetylmuramoyl-L-alanine amidase